MGYGGMWKISLAYPLKMIIVFRLDCGLAKLSISSPKKKAPVTRTARTRVSEGDRHAAHR